jgi:hypothetical protein
MPVFNEGFDPDVFEECVPGPGNLVWFMREHIAEQSRNKRYSDQQNLVEAQGDKVTPFIVRAVFDAVRILKTGTCPDNVLDHGPGSAVRTSNLYRVSSIVYQPYIEAFTPGKGILVTYGRLFWATDSLGVIPGRLCGSHSATPELMSWQGIYNSLHSLKNHPF